MVVPIFPLANGEQERESGWHEAQSFPFLRKRTQSTVGDLTVSRQSLRYKTAIDFIISKALDEGIGLDKLLGPPAPSSLQVHWLAYVM